MSLSTTVQNLITEFGEFSTAVLAAVNLRAKTDFSNVTAATGRAALAAAGTGVANTFSAAQTHGANIGSAPATDFGAATSAGWRQTSAGVHESTASGVPAQVLNRLASDGQIAAFNRQGIGIGSISITTTAVAYNTTSDYRLKEALAPADGQASLDLINEVQIYDYEWRVNGQAGRGAIAHELAIVKPTAVSGAKDAVEQIPIYGEPQVDNEGNPVVDEYGNQVVPILGYTERPIYQGVDYSHLVPDLVVAIQRLTARLEAVEP